MGGTASINTLVLGGTVSGANALSTAGPEREHCDQHTGHHHHGQRRDDTTVASGVVLTVGGGGGAGAMLVSNDLTVNGTLRPTATAP